MIRRTLLITCSLLLVACSSSASTKGAGTAGATTTTAEAATGDSTAVTAGADTTAAPTTPAPTTPATPAPTAPAPTTPAPTTPAPTTPAPATTHAPPPTTVPCHNVGNPATTDPASISIRRGDCGEGVRMVQEALNYKMGTSIAVDGRFGPGTEAAVKAFQASVGLTADGIVGMTTWAALSDDGT